MLNPRRVATCNQQQMCYSIWWNGQSTQSLTTMVYLAARFQVLVISNIALSCTYPQVLAYSLFWQSGVGKSSLINECFSITEAVRPLSRLVKINSWSLSFHRLESWHIKYQYCDHSKWKWKVCCARQSGLWSQGECKLEESHQFFER